ncbi:MAG: 3-oxo-tetronate kinase [Pseudomonadota bacterium]
MLIGVIADDFTGASDIANTLAKGLPPAGGLRAALYPGVPATPAEADIEAGVIALKSRSAPVADAVRDSLSALDWLRSQGCAQILFKYCSTFDSTPEGNIGPVAEALAAALGARATVVCPAFPATGRTLFQGHLFVFDRLLSESGMQDHPLTPMTDPDIRRWLGQQVTGRVGHLPLATVAAGAAAVAAALAEETADFVVADAVGDDDLLTLGAGLAEAPLITGGSGIALGLPANMIRMGRAKGGGAAAVAVEGPAAILAGSCSRATLGQVERHRAANKALAVDVAAVMRGAVRAETLIDFATDAGAAPLIYSSDTPAAVQDAQSRFGRDAVAAALDTLFADTARGLVARGFRRIVVAGGETSGAVAQALAGGQDGAALRIGPEIDPGVPVLYHGGDTPIAVALKSGNFGGLDFFDKALRVMQGTHA